MIATAICESNADVVIYLLTAYSCEVAVPLGPYIRSLCIRGIMGKPVNLMEVAKNIQEAVRQIGEQRR